ncbi:UDP-N-Acetylglucosamine 2-epimerase [Allosphingosinicella indica]|uniref:UDP-N-acetylglucosamine 2-epimerase (non-hydrolyzing) n=2 Tax=Allosphingosinicella indica TaxID=941907 RepID=A0A1X7GJR2_9SPHN|nr:UDP-N-Acetylglucosamine 2-epimerase [Allosphingosinicella indica]
MAPVLRALAARGFAQHIVLTGQHGGLRPHIPPALQADTAEIGFDPAHLSAGEIREHLRDRLRPAMLAASPAIVLVQGDTSSALAGALAAHDSRLPIGHVEAGLRSHHPTDPWPEEIHRIVIDRIATLLFAPSETALRNLRSERVRGQAIVTGNSGIDALLATTDAMGTVERDSGARRLILVTCHRRENRGDRLTGIAAALRRLVDELPVRVLLPLHANPHVAGPIRDLLGGSKHIELVPPLDYEATVRLLRQCWLVLTDSGGLQEEAPAFGTPVLVLRDATERTEPCPCLKLVGADPARIYREVRALVDQPHLYETMATPAFPFGDGAAGPRIAEAIARWLERA